MWCKNGSHKAKLSPFALGAAFGITEALLMLVLAWAGWLGGLGSAIIQHIASFVSGYGPSLMGGVIGGAWGLIDGFVFGFIAGFIYNCCICCCKKSSSCEENESK